MLLHSRSITQESRGKSAEITPDTGVGSSWTARLATTNAARDEGMQDSVIVGSMRQKSSPQPTHSSADAKPPKALAANSRAGSSNAKKEKVVADITTAPHRMERAPSGFSLLRRNTMAIKPMAEKASESRKVLNAVASPVGKIPSENQVQYTHASRRPKPR